MWLEFIRVWCGVSVSGAFLLTLVLPLDAADNSVCNKENELQHLADTLCNSAGAHPITASGGNEHEVKFVEAQNLAQIAPPNLLPPPELLKPNPNRERFPQPAPNPVPEQPSTIPPVQQSPTPSPSPLPPSGTLQVNRIKVTGSTIFGEKQFSPIIKQVEGRTATLEELRGVADKITQLYLDQGYITSRAILVDQTVTNGIVEIRVIEGSLEKIEVQGTRRLQQSYIRSRISLGAGTPLNTSKLEEQLRLLRTDPLLENVEASLRAGDKAGQSILIVRVREANPFVGSVGADNYSPPSVGSERFGINLAYLDLTGRGDELAGSYYRTTTGGADVLDFSYRIPINPMNGTIELRAAPNRNKVTQPPFNVFDIKGESQLYEISYRQPIIRSPRQELALSLGFDYQSNQTFLGGEPTPFGEGPNKRGLSRTNAFKFGQDYLLRDLKGAWSLRSLFSLGTGLFDATIQPHPIPDGRFLTWLGQLQRVQLLNQDNLLIVSGDIQLASTSLLPAQQFVIGGGQSLRGYRQNVRAGDNGFRLSVEDRITLQRNQSGASTIQLAPFTDFGEVWNAKGDPNLLPSHRFLVGIGLGIIWQPLTNLLFRLDYGAPVIPIKDRGNNAQDSGFYFSVNYQLR